MVNIYVFQTDISLFNDFCGGSTLSLWDVYNFCKDRQIGQYFNCSYEQCMNQIIDV